MPIILACDASPYGIGTGITSILINAEELGKNTLMDPLFSEVFNRLKLGKTFNDLVPGDNVEYTIEGNCIMRGIRGIELLNVVPECLRDYVLKILWSLWYSENEESILQCSLVADDIAAVSKNCWECDTVE